MSVHIYAIKAFTDNYIWCLSNGQQAVVVDPGDAQPVIAYLREHQLTLSAILITHHHHDHTGGLSDLLAASGDIPVFGPHNSAIPLVNQPVAEGDNVQLKALALTFNVSEVPGHTLDHIAYYTEGMLFCGDTLFSVGCGRLFEGTPKQMHNSLSRLAMLPESTKVYCTHEYTLANINFALVVEPSNVALLEYHQWAKQQREVDHATLPSNIKLEREINPFLRCDSKEIREATHRHWQTSQKTSEDVFAALRRWKDEI